MYILNAANGRINLIALGTNGKLGAKSSFKVLTIPWNDEAPPETAAQLDLAMCRASKPLDVGFGA